jgi:hypothetical protein
MSLNNLLSIIYPIIIYNIPTNIKIKQKSKKTFTKPKFNNLCNNTHKYKINKYNHQYLNKYQLRLNQKYHN